jgi:hypothetical protein
MAGVTESLNAHRRKRSLSASAMTAARHFAQSYEQARHKFCAAAQAADLDVMPHAHPMLGRDGESLSMDVVRDGDPNARAMLIITSGCHGIEGFCGSGVQVALLSDPAWRELTRASGIAVLYIHALNPYGFSWWRRVTQENVDLNRNFHDFNRPPPANPQYDEIAHLLVPNTWPPSQEVNDALQRYMVEHGERVLQAVISGGQYTHPQGLFYGGANPTWSHVTLRHVLREHGSRCARLGWIDLHTGLGPSGLGERIFACRDDPAALARARRWWGDEVTSIYDGSSSSALLSGLMWLAAYDECPQAEYTGIALEYGTQPLDQVMNALRADQWLENHPEVGPEVRFSIKRQMLEAFYTDTDEWKRRVVDQAADAARQAVRGLASL